MAVSLNSFHGVRSPYEKTGSKDNQAEIVDQIHFPEVLPPLLGGLFLLPVFLYGSSLRLSYLEILPLK